MTSAPHIDYMPSPVPVYTQLTRSWPLRPGVPSVRLGC